MALPYYVTPLMGALAWASSARRTAASSTSCGARSAARAHLIDINTPVGIAWVMALFEGSVAFVMIGAVMKSMDPALEEASQVLGAGRLRTMLRITLPLVAARRARRRHLRLRRDAGLVLGRAGARARRAGSTSSPPRCTSSCRSTRRASRTAAAMGVSLFAVMFVDGVDLPPHRAARGSYVTITGKAFRPRAMDVGGLRWPLLAICVAYLGVAVVLPVLTLVYASFQRLPRRSRAPTTSRWTTTRPRCRWTRCARRCGTACSWASPPRASASC